MANRIVQLPFLSEEMGSFPPSAPPEKVLQGKYVVLIQEILSFRRHTHTTYKDNEIMCSAWFTVYPFVVMDCIPFKSSSWPCAIRVCVEILW